MRSYFIFLVLLLLSTVGFFFIRQIDFKPPKKWVETNPESSKKLKNGEFKNYDNNGNLKTLVNYKDGLKHGRSFIYYENGQVMLEMTYNEGKREGKSIKYYRNGIIYAETPYKNDRVNGIRRVYYPSGKIKANIPYQDNLPGIGLEEFFTSGNMKYDTQPKITIQKSGNQLNLSININDCKDIEYFIGKLVNERFFEEQEVKVRLPVRGSKSVIDLSRYTPSFLKYQDIICKCTTKQGNPLIIKNNY